MGFSSCSENPSKAFMHLMRWFSGQKAGDPEGKELIFRKMTGARGYGNWFFQIHRAWGGGQSSHRAWISPSRRNETSGQSKMGPESFDSTSQARLACFYFFPFCGSKIFCPSLGQIGKNDIDGQISLGTFLCFGRGSDTLTFQGTGFRKIGLEVTCAWRDAG